jgi:hypothetical protein
MNSHRNHRENPESHQAAQQKAQQFLSTLDWQRW